MATARERSQCTSLLQMDTDRGWAADHDHECAGSPKGRTVSVL